MNNKVDDDDDDDGFRASLYNEFSINLYSRVVKIIWPLLASTF